MSCGSPVPSSGVGGNVGLLQYNPLRRVGCPAEGCDYCRASPVTHRLQLEVIREEVCQCWSQHPCRDSLGNAGFELVFAESEAGGVGVRGWAG